MFGGRIAAFEITIDGDLKWSGLKTHTFPTDAEIDAMV